MAIRLSWQKTPAKSLVSTAAGAYTSVYRYAAPDREYRPTPPQNRA